ncbi:MAG: hypothetical protein WA775_14370 [Psychroserpens sp.]|uniref:hypothetical protein n=1 Tax=Psychroserpens sp. TaxID=2020870 RepID=UPI003C78E34E
MNTQCDDDDFVEIPCDQSVIVDSAFYVSAESDDYEIINFSLNDNCLALELSGSGCDGATWSMVLVDSGAVAESNPSQRFLKLIFSNDELCTTAISQIRSFDLSVLEVQDFNEIVLNIEGFDAPINYTY